MEGDWKPASSLCTTRATVSLFTQRTTVPRRTPACGRSNCFLPELSPLIVISNAVACGTVVAGAAVVVVAFGAVVVTAAAAVVAVAAAVVVAAGADVVVVAPRRLFAPAAFLSTLTPEPTWLSS